MQHGTPTCTKLNRAPDFKKEPSFSSVMLTVSGRASGHDQSDPRTKVPACYSHTRSLAGPQNVSSLSHFYLFSMQNQLGKASRCLPFSLLPQPLFSASQRSCLRLYCSLSPTRSSDLGSFKILQVLDPSDSSWRSILCAKDISFVNFLSPIV